MGYRTMQLRRGKPARVFNGTFYRPGVPIDPSDPNLQDPAFQTQLQSCPLPVLEPVKAPEPVVQTTYETAELEAADPDDHVPKWNDDEEN